MGDQGKRKEKNGGGHISRRNFLKLTGSAALAAGVLPNLIWLDDAIAAIPVSEGYLLVDTKKCQGCLFNMPETPPCTVAGRDFYKMEFAPPYLKSIGGASCRQALHDAGVSVCCLSK